MNCYPKRVLGKPRSPQHRGRDARERTTSAAVGVLSLTLHDANAHALYNEIKLTTGAHVCFDHAMSTPRSSLSAYGRCFEGFTEHFNHNLKFMEWMFLVVDDNRLSKIKL